MPETWFDGKMTEAILTGPRRSPVDFTDFRPPSGKLPLRRNSDYIFAFLGITAFHPGNCYMQKVWDLLLFGGGSLAVFLLLFCLRY